MASFDYDVVINGPATEALNLHEVQETQGSIRIRA